MAALIDTDDRLWIGHDYYSLKLEESTYAVKKICIAHFIYALTLDQTIVAFQNRNGDYVKAGEISNIENIIDFVVNDNIILCLIGDGTLRVWMISSDYEDYFDPIEEELWTDLETKSLHRNNFNGKIEYIAEDNVVYRVEESFGMLLSKRLFFIDSDDGIACIVQHVENCLILTDQGINYDNYSYTIYEDYALEKDQQKDGKKKNLMAPMGGPKNIIKTATINNENSSVLFVLDIDGSIFFDGVSRDKLFDCDICDYSDGFYTYNYTSFGNNCGVIIDLTRNGQLLLNNEGKVWLIKDDLQSLDLLDGYPRFKSLPEKIFSLEQTGRVKSSRSLL